MTDAQLNSALGVPPSSAVYYTKVKVTNGVALKQLFFKTEQECTALFCSLSDYALGHNKDRMLKKEVALPPALFPGARPIIVNSYMSELPYVAPVAAVSAPATPVAATSSVVRTPGGSDVMRIKVIRGAFDDATPGKARGVKVTGDAAEVNAAIAAAAGFDATAKLIVTDSEGDVVSIPSGLVADQTFYVDTL
jgi:hypothetical protein